MDLQTLSDRAEIIDLISAYNKASFYCDVKGYRTVVRTSDGWRFFEIISFFDRKMSDALVTNLRGLVLGRPTILHALSTLLEVDGGSVLNAVKSGTALVTLSDVSEANVINAVARAFQQCAPASNPLPDGTARALAYVLTHDQVYGADVENNFRAAGWNGPPTLTTPGSAKNLSPDH
jgi:hypothetical protein